MMTKITLINKNNMCMISHTQAVDTPGKKCVINKTNRGDDK
jgi:hypothetical protein